MTWLIMRKLALPRAMAFSGAGAYTIVSHARQENLARDLEDDGLDIERLIGVLAETAKSAATSRTNAIAACRQVNDLLARKMGRQCAIWRFPSVADRCGARWQFGLRRLQFFQRQFELSDLRRQLLR
jgi:hypothetical protein